MDGHRTHPRYVIGVLDGRLVVGGGADEATVGIVGVGGCKDCTFETAALFTDGLAEEVFVAARKAGRGR